MADSSIIKQFFFTLGLHMPSLKDSLNQGQKAVEDFTNKSKRILAGFGIAGGAGAFGKIVFDYASLGNKLQTFADSTGMTVDGMSKIGMALERFGGNTETAMNTFQGLQQSMREAVDWGTGPLMNVMSKYGFSLYDQQGKLKDTKELYLSIADTMQRLTKSQQIDMGRALGLDDASVRMLQSGRKSVEALMASRSRFGAMTAADARIAAEFNNAIVDSKQLLAGFGRQVARVALPAIKKFVDFGQKLFKTLDENKGVVLSISNAISNNMVPAFIGGLALISKAMAPFLLKLAPLTAIALLIDDISVFMANNGGRSIIGDLLGDKGDGIRKALNNVFGSLGGILKGVFTGDFEGALSEAKKLWNEGIVPLAQELGPILKRGFELGLQLLKEGLIVAGPLLKAGLTDAWDAWLKYWRNNNDTWFDGIIDKFFDMIDSLIGILNKIPGVNIEPLNYSKEGQHKKQIEIMRWKGFSNTFGKLGDEGAVNVAGKLYDFRKEIISDAKLYEEMIKKQTQWVKYISNGTADKTDNITINIENMKFDNARQFFDYLDSVTNGAVAVGTN